MICCLLRLLLDQAHQVEDLGFGASLWDLGKHFAKGFGGDRDLGCARLQVVQGEIAIWGLPVWRPISWAAASADWGIGGPGGYWAWWTLRLGGGYCPITSYTICSQVCQGGAVKLEMVVQQFILYAIQFLKLLLVATKKTVCREVDSGEGLHLAVARLLFLATPDYASQRTDYRLR